MDLVSFTEIGTSDDVKGDDLKDDEVKLLILVSGVHNYVFDTFKRVVSVEIFSKG